MEKKVSAEKVGQFRFSGTAAHPGVSLRFEALVLQDGLQDISTTGVDSGGREGTAGDSIDGEKQPEIVVLRQKSCAISQVKNGLSGSIPAASAILLILQSNVSWRAGSRRHSRGYGLLFELQALLCSPTCLPQHHEGTHPRGQQWPA
jgi:hypothetical protein